MLLYLAMEAVEWNVVVIGCWNLAILTPGRIGTKVFGLGKGVPVDVLVQLEGASTFQVKHGNVIAVPAYNQLLLQTTESNNATLTEAMSYAKNAVMALPETPFYGCGINFRYHWNEIPAKLAGLVRCASEGLVSDLGYDIVHRRRGESVRFGDGRLNINIDLPEDGGARAVFNFDRSVPTTTQATDWLSQDIENLSAVVQKILEGYDA